MVEALTTDNVLFGHTSEDTALFVDDYPYGRKLRTTIRYWIETTKHGDRFCRQTINPKTGRWNKPKKSTYLTVAVLYTDEKAHVQYTGLGTWPKHGEVAQFLGIVGVERLSEEQRLALAKLIGRLRAFEHVTFEVRSGGFESEEAREAHEAEQARIEENIRKLAAVEAYQAHKALGGAA